MEDVPDAHTFISKRDRGYAILAAKSPRKVVFSGCVEGAETYRENFLAPSPESFPSHLSVLSSSHPVANAPGTCTCRGGPNAHRNRRRPTGPPGRRGA